MSITKLLAKAEKLERVPMELVTFRIPPRYFDEADELAEETGTTRADVLRTALIDGLSELRAQMDEGYDNAAT